MFTKKTILFFGLIAGLALTPTVEAACKSGSCGTKRTIIKSPTRVIRCNNKTSAQSKKEKLEQNVRNTYAKKISKLRKEQKEALKRQDKRQKQELKTLEMVHMLQDDILRKKNVQPELISESVFKINTLMKELKNGLKYTQDFDYAQQMGKVEEIIADYRKKEDARGKHISSFDSTVLDLIQREQRSVLRKAHKIEEEQTKEDHKEEIEKQEDERDRRIENIWGRRISLTISPTIFKNIQERC